MHAKIEQERLRKPKLISTYHDETRLNGLHGAALWDKATNKVRVRTRFNEKPNSQNPC